MTDAVKIVGIAGSPRRGSFNVAAIEAARELAPAEVDIHRFDLADVPLYNEDVRAQGFPVPVATLRQAIADADGVLIATPEYNYSMSGVLKNAIDWISRPPDQPFDGKPIAIMGASPGRLGTARAQYHLRQSFVFLNGSVLNKPEVMIGEAMKVFADGKLQDETTREFVAGLVAALADAARANR